MFGEFEIDNMQADNEDINLWIHVNQGQHCLNQDGELFLSIILKRLEPFETPVLKENLPYMDCHLGKKVECIKMFTIEN